MDGESAGSERRRGEEASEQSTEDEADELEDAGLVADAALHALLDGLEDGGGARLVRLARAARRGARLGGLLGGALEAVRVQQVLALAVHLDAALGAPQALPREPPQQRAALVAVRRLRRRPHLELVRRRQADRVHQRLHRLPVHVRFLHAQKHRCTRLRAHTHDSPPMATAVN